MSSQSGKNVKYPGIPSTTDGAGAVVWVETHITQGAAAFPITSSTTMGQGYELAHSNGVKNLWGEPLQFTQLESEHSAQTTCEGFALAGGRVSNFTSGQGLIYLWPRFNFNERSSLHHFWEKTSDGTAHWFSRDDFSIFKRTLWSRRRDGLC